MKELIGDADCNSSFPKNSKRPCLVLLLTEQISFPLKFLDFCELYAVSQAKKLIPHLIKRIAKRIPWGCFIFLIFFHVTNFDLDIGVLFSYALLRIFHRNSHNNYENRMKEK